MVVCLVTDITFIPPGCAADLAKESISSTLTTKASGRRPRAEEPMASSLEREVKREI